MKTVLICWSGGKDSTCATMMYLLGGGYKCIVVCYIPMFTKEIPLILKNHYEHILKTAKRFEELGAEVHIVTGQTYWDYVTRMTKRGKYKGLIYGFPCTQTGKCGFRRDSKEKAISRLDVGQYDFMDIGIAYDETKRHAQLNDKKRSILVEKKITEKMATEFCIAEDMYSPNYKTNPRDGCTLCYNAREEERQQWYKDYPQAVPLLKKLQWIVNEKRPERKPLRKQQWFIPEIGLDGVCAEQISLF